MARLGNTYVLDLTGVPIDGYWPVPMDYAHISVTREPVRVHSDQWCKSGMPIEEITGLREKGVI